MVAESDDGHQETQGTHDPQHPDVLKSFGPENGPDGQTHDGLLEPHCHRVALEILVEELGQVQEKGGFGVAVFGDSQPGIPGQNEPAKVPPNPETRPLVDFVDEVHVGKR